MRTPHNTLLNRRAWLESLVAAAIAGGLPTLVRGDDGPNSSLFSGRLRAAPAALRPDGLGPLPAPATSWYEIPLPPPKEVKVNDIITIRVDVSTRMTADAEWQRRKNGRFDALLNDFVVLKGLRAVKPAPQTDGDQRIQGNLNIQDRSQGELETTESLKFEIAATVASVLPNGNLVLEAHRTVRNNHDYWMHSLSGVCRRDDVGPGNIVLSNDLANLQVDKREMGQVRDSYKRGWLTRFWDEFTPF
ncbi:MAG: flagellar basal body L-ring protein FlgH [Pirellulaceae bacterium]